MSSLGTETNRDEQIAATTDGFKVLGKHRKGCWGHEAGGFYSCDGHENRTKTGRKGGSTWWYRFLCNDPFCEAVAIVRADVLAAFVNEGVGLNAEV